MEYLEYRVIRGDGYSAVTLPIPVGHLVALIGEFASGGCTVAESGSVDGIDAIMFVKEGVE